MIKASKLAGSQRHPGYVLLTECNEQKNNYDLHRRNFIMSTPYIIGFVCGLLAVALVYAFKRKVLHSKARCEELDERQKIVNGQAYKLGFFSLMAANFVYAFVESNLKTVHINNFVGAFACICVGIGAYAGYSIFHDSYYGIKNYSKRYLIFFTLWGIVSGISAVLQISRGKLVVNGVIGDTGMFICCAVLMLAIVIMTLIHKASRKNDEE